ncbi:hypothetical protein [Agrococcus sp. ARC_14]|uniref:hypothetical protein n=1 Tax=Agrococcus sp. ARC_14 TaxID=2919927 RepID=UPI001F06F6B6|nr:hypothetical protein [Agrococcus sp. ARC_14]MCH1884340.1 hypothetical protein [Agrococcus sp. ARC_14]
MSREAPGDGASSERGADATAADEAVAARVDGSEAELVADEQPQPQVIRRRGRRVTTEPPPGYTGEPAVERHTSNENDARLKGDVPPHWG